MSVDLLIVDPQNDFLDKKGVLYNKSLTKVSKSLTSFIDKNIQHIDNIYVCLRSNSLISPRFPYFWKNIVGRHPEIDDTILPSDLDECTWLLTRFNADVLDSIKYELLVLGETAIKIEKPHCIAGSWGSLIQGDLLAIMQYWSFTKKIPITPYIRNSADIFTDDICNVKFLESRLVRNSKETILFTEFLQAKITPSFFKEHDNILIKQIFE